MDEHALIKEREQAHLAKQITEHPLWLAAWTELEARLTDGWRNSRDEAAEHREFIYLQLKAARAVRRSFETLIETGQLAEMQLEERSSGRSSTGSTAEH